MKHLRNSFCLDLKVECKLTTGETIVFRPKDLKYDNENDPKHGRIESAFEDFYLQMNGDTILNKTYNSQQKGSLADININDGYYRYILPDIKDDENNEILFKWRYNYHDITYAGGYTVNPVDAKKWDPFFAGGDNPIR